MLDLFEFGVFLVETFEAIGDFLIVDHIPISPDFIAKFAGAMDTLGLHYGADLVSEFLSSDLTIATLILGPSLIVMLCIRLIKFFTDIVL